ncbi:MAG TPA: hypothetical protein VIK00_02440 [Candidatus Limnocylindrales bacterium]
MNPDEIRFFAGRYLAPRLTWLKRHDLAWVEPSDAEFVCPIEFVASPIGWIKCSLTLTSPPAHLGRETHVLVGVRTLPLYCPEADALDVGIKRGHGLLSRLSTFRHRWAIGSGAGEEVATELARAIEEQWPAAIRQIGTPQGVAEEIRGEAARDIRWLETLAYSRMLAGDRVGAGQAIAQILRNPNRTGAVNSRVTQINRVLFSDPAVAADRLFEWRRERLEAQGLVDIAAPRPALEVADPV